MQNYKVGFLKTLYEFFLMKKSFIESEPKVAHNQRNPMNQINLIS
jgi:hypothetical protein